VHCKRCGGAGVCLLLAALGYMLILQYKYCVLSALHPRKRRTQLLCALDWAAAYD
jgi:hypothetical protein